MNTKKNDANINLMQSLVDANDIQQHIVDEISGMLRDYANVVECSTKKLIYDGVCSNINRLRQYIDVAASAIKRISSNANALHAVNSIQHNEINNECRELAKKFFFDYNKSHSTAFNTNLQLHVDDTEFNKVQKECADLAVKRFNIHEHDPETTDGNFAEYMNMNDVSNDELDDVKDDVIVTANETTKSKKTKAKARTTKKPRTKVAAVKRIDAATHE